MDEDDEKLAKYLMLKNSQYNLYISKSSSSNEGLYFEKNFSISAFCFSNIKYIDFSLLHLIKIFVLESVISL